MKRALLIAGGTVGGLGAVLAITPPQLGSSTSGLGGGLDLAPVSTTDNATATPEATVTPAASSTSSPVAKKTSNAKPAAVTTKTSQPTAAATQSAAATKSPTASASASATANPTKATSNKATSGTFAGDPYTMRYGTVQVQITISGGKITDAQALQAPSGRDQRYTDMAVPVMRQKTIAAQSANITGVSGASYTAYAWYVSLQSALKKAGWM
jgi:uncharacterized protein with FMN-binding domain